MIVGCGETEPPGSAEIPNAAFGTVGDDPSTRSTPSTGANSEIPTAVFGDPSRDPDAIRQALADTSTASDSSGPTLPCEPGVWTPCVCVDGATGLRPCEDELAPCECDTCPGQPSPSPTGMLMTSIGQFLFDAGHIALTHRSGAASGGAGCVISAALSVYVGGAESPACQVTVHADGDLINGALPLTTLTFEADAGCLGLSPQDQGTYSATEFNEGRLLLSPNAVSSGAVAECWTGSMTLTVEALLTRSDGQQITLSTSEISATGSGLSLGEDRVCPQSPDAVDINDCPKVVPATATCNPYCQLGCNPGDHCVVDGSTFGCLPTGTFSYGEDCTTPGSCAYGLSCFTLSSEGSARCHAPCITDVDCPPPAACNTTASIGGGLSLSICSAPSESCDILDPSSCGEGQSCYLNGNTAQCLPNGTLGAGEICEGGPANNCAPGLSCLVTCRELCSTDNEQPSCSVCGGGHHEFSPSLGLGFCLIGGPPTLCDLFTQADCEADKGCYPVMGGIACRHAGSLTPGSPCQSGNSCTPGYACVNGGCLQLCDLSALASTATSCEARCPSSMGAILPESWQIGVCLDL
jgi:hypothetical protein